MPGAKASSAASSVPARARQVRRTRRARQGRPMRRMACAFDCTGQVGVHIGGVVRQCQQLRCGPFGAAKLVGGSHAVAYQDFIQPPKLCHGKAVARRQRGHVVGMIDNGQRAGRQTTPHQRGLPGTSWQLRQRAL